MNNCKKNSHFSYISCQIRWKWSLIKQLNIVHISINYFIFKNPATKIVTQILEVKWIQQKTERFDIECGKRWWKLSISFIRQFLWLTKHEDLWFVTWSYSGENVEIVDQFVYLGVMFNFNGKLFVTQKQLAAQGRKAMFALK